MADQPSTTVPLSAPGRGVERRWERIMDAVSTVLSSGWYVHGAQHEAFEEELSAYLGLDRCLGVASGTDALELALRAVTAGRTGVVLTAANAGGYATAAARRCGLTPGWVDIDSSTLCLDPVDLDRRIGQDVAAVVVTHLYGRMADVEAVVERCAPKGIPVIEDCAQAIGARRGGRAAGTLGDLAAFSFYPTKNLGALGDGGAVGTSRPALAERVARLRQYGWSEKYVVREPGGVNSRLDELQAAVLRVRLADLDEGNRRRRRIIARYREAAADGPLRMLPADGEDHVGHLAVGLTEPGQRDRLREALEMAGVATDVHYPIPDHRQAAWSTWGARVDLPVTEEMAERVVSLPCFPELTEAEVTHVCRSVAAL